VRHVTSDGWSFPATTLPMLIHDTTVTILLIAVSSAYRN
jgi:hypothetical protein